MDLRRRRLGLTIPARCLTPPRSARGLVTYYVLFVIHHATRRVEIAGITPHPDRRFMAQVARNLTDTVDGFLRDKKFLILDNAPSFTKQFGSILDATGVRVVRTAIQAPNMNSFAERWVRNRLSASA